MLDIQVLKTDNFKEKPVDESQLGFGKVFTDHMFVMDYDEQNGWHHPRIEPYHPFTLDPSCSVFHYAQEVFEGLKAYRSQTGIQLFRPECNGERFQKSCDRLCIPTIPVEDFVQACMKLVEVEQDWVPSTFGASLYLRPFVIATEPVLGVHPSKTYIFCIIASPSGAYYKEGLAPIRIYVEDDYIRTAPGLTGFAKCGGNYAASLKSSQIASALGYAQVLWLDGIEHKYVEEVGAMNIFFKIAGKIYTAPCVGTVLDGVTRRSVIELCKDYGYEVIIERLSIDDVMEAGRNHTLEEVFGTGTAAVISPIKELKYKGEQVYIGDGKIGTLTQKLYDELTGIQWGKIEDTKHWVKKI